MVSHDPLIGAYIDKYLIDRMVGQGSLGMVYHGLDTVLGREVAVKVCSLEFSDDDELAQRFQRETRIMGQLRHENLIGVYAGGEQAGQLYLVMEYIDGPTIRDLVKSKGPVPFSKSLGWIRQVCYGLKHAGLHGVIHRDIKPDNIAIDSKGRVVLMEFGFAKIDHGDSLWTATGVVLGSPYYMSPEQSAARPLDHRTDIYALCATLYFMLTRRPPFEGRNLVEVVKKRAKNDLRPIVQINPEVRPEVAIFVAKGMASEPDNRFQTYDEMIEALDWLLNLPESSPSQEDSETEDPSTISGIFELKGEGFKPKWLVPNEKSAKPKIERTADRGSAAKASPGFIRRLFGGRGERSQSKDTQAVSARTEPKPAVQPITRSAPAREPSPIIQPPPIAVAGQAMSQPPIAPQAISPQPDPVAPQPAKPRASGPQFDAFISYRRSSDSQTSRLLSTELQLKKYRVFRDVDNLGVGHFDEALLHRIAEASCFIIILSPGSLDRCTSPEDWLRREIAYALAISKPVIPILMPEFRFPPEEDLPPDLHKLRIHNGIKYSDDYFKEMIERLIKFLGSPLGS